MYEKLFDNWVQILLKVISWKFQLLPTLWVTEIRWATFEGFVTAFESYSIVVK